jgi:cytochrome c biogenesis factor
VRLRRQLLLLLAVLTIGMVAGAHWAYVELGWGGYWAWDPVENTALLPWLAVLGALHGLVRSRSGGEGLRLAGAMTCASLALAVLGTMLTRSGAAPSVHAFGEDAAVGRALVALTAVVVATSALAVVRLRPVPPLDPGRPPERWLAWALQLQPWLAAFAVVVVLAGTVRPLLGDADVAVAGRFYSALLAPVAAVGVVLALRFRPAHLAHVAAAVFAVGIVGSAFATSATATLAPGESMTVGSWEVVNEGARATGERTVAASVVLRRGGDEVTTLEPSLVAHPERGILLAETSLRSTPLTDVQVALRDADDDGRALLEVHVRPLVWFVWLGPLLLAAACAKAAFAGALPRRSDEQLHDRSLTA